MLSAMSWAIARGLLACPALRSAAAVIMATFVL
jgi:hypothetical protein